MEQVSEAQLIGDLKGLFGLTKKNQAELRAWWNMHQLRRISEKQWVILARALLWRKKKGKKRKNRKVAKIRIRSPFSSQATRWSRVRLFQGGLGR